ncbi:hypothetical protein MHYP_G00125680 [Metynnis hypsauchen]
MKEQKQAIFSSGCASMPQEVSVLSWWQVVLILPLYCGILQHCQALHKANRIFAYTFSQLRFDSAKLVELQPKTICEGLESEHWWVLSNEFYHLFPAQTKVSKTLKMVSIGSDGSFRTHQSSNTWILEMPALFMVSSKPRGPPPSF